MNERRLGRIELRRRLARTWAGFIGAANQLLLLVQLDKALGGGWNSNPNSNTTNRPVTTPAQPVAPTRFNP